MRLYSVPCACLASLLLIVATGCDHGVKQPVPSAQGAGVGADHRFEISVGGQVVRMRLAVLTHERNRGLMHVPSMPEDEGMLFVFAEPQKMSFYMRNTRIPLDIGYFGNDGVLREVRPMYPFVEDSVPSESDEIQLALEMNQGWYARHGVRPGAKIDLSAVRESLRHRGLDPASVFATR